MSHQVLKIEDILEAGLHLGHSSSTWNPRMKPYIFGERKGIHVIDPEKSIEFLEKACKFVKETISGGSDMLFVGTKHQIAGIIEEEAKRCGAFYCIRRWLGGTLTNFVTIRKSVEKLKSLEEKRDKGDFGRLTKKEVISIERLIEKMHRNLDGVLDMDGLPGVLYITDVRKDKIAVNEAIKLNIPVVAIVDTNVDPNIISCPIPGNDDGIKSVGLVTHIIASAVLEGKALRKDER